MLALSTFILLYKSLINKRVEELLKYIKCFNELKKVSQERIHFMVRNCYELIVDVYKRHPFSFEKEYNRFKQVVNFSFKKSQAIKAEVGGIKKNIETVLLAEFFFIKNINMVKAPKETRKIW